MKKIISTLAFVLLCAFAFSQNGSVLEYKISSTNGTGGSLKLSVSEFGSISVFNMVIPQMPGGGMTMKHLCMTQSPDVVYMINDNNKTYSETKPDNVALTGVSYSARKLGEETVNGYKCVHALVTEGTESHEVWYTKDIPDYEKYARSYKSNKRMYSEQRERALKAAGCEGLPVKTVHKGNVREGDMTMELVKVEKKAFSASDFQIPSGYTKTESANSAAPQFKSQQELMNMSPEERAKYAEEMKKKYQK